MTHSLMGRSGIVDPETGVKVNYPPLDPRKRDAIIGKIQVSVAIV